MSAPAETSARMIGTVIAGDGSPAVTKGISACFFIFYNVPAQWIGTHSDPWPEDHMKRSYFTGGICGDGTDKPCPDPDLPMPTKLSGYINSDGELVLPDGAEMPVIVPFEPTR